MLKLFRGKSNRARDVSEINGNALGLALRRETAGLVIASRPSSHRASELHEIAADRASG